MSSPRTGTAAHWAANAERAADAARRAWQRIPDRPLDAPHRRMRNAAKAHAFRCIAAARRAAVAARYHDRRAAMHAEDQAQIALGIVRAIHCLASARLAKS